MRVPPRLIADPQPQGLGAGTRFCAAPGPRCGCSHPQRARRRDILRSRVAAFHGSHLARQGRATCCVSCALPPAVHSSSCGTCSNVSGRRSRTAILSASHATQNEGERDALWKVLVPSEPAEKLSCDVHEMPPTLGTTRNLLSHKCVAFLGRRRVSCSWEGQAY